LGQRRLVLGVGREGPVEGHLDLVPDGDGLPVDHPHQPPPGATGLQDHLQPLVLPAGHGLEGEVPHPRLHGVLGGGHQVQGPRGVEEAHLEAVLPFRQLHQPEVDQLRRPHPARPAEPRLERPLGGRRRRAPRIGAGGGHQAPGAGPLARAPGGWAGQAGGRLAPLLPTPARLAPAPGLFQGEGQLVGAPLPAQKRCWPAPGSGRWPAR